MRSQQAVTSVRRLCLMRCLSVFELWQKLQRGSARKASAFDTLERGAEHQEIPHIQISLDVFSKYFVFKGPKNIAGNCGGNSVSRRVLALHKRAFSTLSCNHKTMWRTGFSALLE